MHRCINASMHIYIFFMFILYCARYQITTKPPQPEALEKDSLQTVVPVVPVVPVVVPVVGRRVFGVVLSRLLPIAQTPAKGGTEAKEFLKKVLNTSSE